MKLGIGTAQFGLNYGISNIKGQINLEEASAVLNIAKQNNVRILDTAIAYGDSEAVLGQIIISPDAFDVVTKTPKFANEITEESAKQLQRFFLQSLNRLKRPSVYGLLLHHADNLIAENGKLLYAAMLELRNKGLVKKIGVSVYNSGQIDTIMEKYPLDLIQLPINVFDQRLLQSGHLSLLKKAGVEIHARSIFLQGLLLMKPEDVIQKLPRAAEAVSRFYNHCLQGKKTPLEVALNFVVQQDHIDKVLVGVTSARDLNEILTAYSCCGYSFDYKQHLINDISVINPALW